MLETIIGIAGLGLSLLFYLLGRKQSKDEIIELKKTNDALQKLEINQEKYIRVLEKQLEQRKTEFEHQKLKDGVSFFKALYDEATKY